MNRKILGFAFALMFVAMMVAPVMAVGPMNAEKSNNQNLLFTWYGVLIHLQPGALNEWVNQAGNVHHLLIKSATEFQIKNAFVPSSVNEILPNKWNLLSEDIFFELLLSVGFEPDHAALIAYVVMAGGVYYKEVYIENL